MTEELSLKQVATYLRAPQRLGVVNSFSTASEAKGIGIHYLPRLHSFMYRRAATEKARANQVMRVLTLLSSLEFLSRTPFYDFDSVDPPIDRETIALFVRRHAPYLFLRRFAPAVFFISRYMHDHESRATTKLLFESQNDDQVMSFGEVSSFIELTEHFVNGDEIHSFLSSVYQHYLAREDGISSWSINELQSLPRHVRRTIVNAQRAVERPQALGVTIGLSEFFEFTLNLGIVAGVASNRTINTNLFHALQGCFFPWYADSLALKSIFSAWWEKVEKRMRDVPGAELPIERANDVSSERRDPASTFELTVDDMAKTPPSAASPEIAAEIIEKTVQLSERK